MSRGFRSSLWLIAAIVAAAYLYLRGRADAGVDRDETATLRATRQVLAGADAHRRRQAALATARDAAHTRATVEHDRRRRSEARYRAALERGDTAAAVAAADTAIAAAGIGALQDSTAYVACILAVNECAVRRDSLADLLESNRQLLESRRTFRILFLQLPRPSKPLAAIAGCGLGAFLDAEDRARGCGVGAAALQLGIPTR